MKNLIFAMSILSASVVSAAVPTVTLTGAVQNEDRTVSVSYTLANGPAVVTFGVQTNAGDGAWVAVDAANLWRTVGDVNRIVSASSGSFRWSPDHADLSEKFAVGGLRVVLTAWALDDTPDYMSVDLTSGAAQSTERLRFYENAAAVPGGVLSNGEYRTSVLLMKRIPAAHVTWTMGSSVLRTERGTNEKSHEVTLDADYYLGVFPITSAQLSTILDGTMQYSSFTKESAMRVRDGIYYNKNFPSARDANWPDDPASTSVLGKLRTKTGQLVAFDLPTEAQWEFAARANQPEGVWGDGTPYASDISSTGVDANLPGRYLYNQANSSWSGNKSDQGPENGTPIAGSYPPNAFGLYDMNGGADEWCLDWYQADITALGGAVNISRDDGSKCADGVTETTWRVIRGGSWRRNAVTCQPTRRESREGFYAGDSSESGMRVCCPVSFTVQKED